MNFEDNSNRTLIFERTRVPALTEGSANERHCQWQAHGCNQSGNAPHVRHLRMQNPPKLKKFHDINPYSLERES